MKRDLFDGIPLVCPSVQTDVTQFKKLYPQKESNMFTKKSGVPEHAHKIDVDGQGTGQTTDTHGDKPHTHKIIDWQVHPPESTVVAAHTHELESDHIASVNTVPKDTPTVEIEEYESSKPAIVAASVGDDDKTEA